MKEPSDTSEKLQWPKVLVFCLLALLGLTVLGLFHGYVIRSHTIRAFKIGSASIAPTLLPGDQILVDKTLSPRNVQRRDIIVFIFPENPQKRFMHRVVGLPGEQIELRGEHLLIDGKQTREDYVLHTSNDFVPKRDNFAPVVVPPESLFVMGDNRDRSYDSRFWGPVHFEKVLGRAEMIYWSWDKENLTVRWGRIGKRIEQGSSG